MVQGLWDAKWGKKQSTIVRVSISLLLGFACIWCCWFALLCWLVLQLMGLVASLYHCWLMSWLLVLAAPVVSHCSHSCFLLWSLLFSLSSSCRKGDDKKPQTTTFQCWQQWQQQQSRCNTMLCSIIVAVVVVVVIVRWHTCCIVDKKHMGMSNCRVSSWFCSHPVGSYLWDQEWTTNPYQDRPSSHLTISPWHHSPSLSTYLINDGSHIRVCDSVRMPYFVM